MKCKYCDSKIPDDSVFCENCGAKVKGKSTLKWWIIGGAVAVSLIFACGGLLGYFPFHEPSPIVSPNDTAMVDSLQLLADNKTDQTFTVGDVTFKMIFVKGGTFQMGSTSGEDDEKPVHSVTLSDYYMGETEVTQALWKAVMGDNNNHSYWKGNQLPVESVSWNECDEFVSCLNSLIASELPKGYCFSLPSEAQWEYAARGGEKSLGCMYAGSNNVDSVAWYYDNYGNFRTHKVKQKEPNELGLYDMSGNVWEWCEDWFGSYGDSAQADPRGPSSGGWRSWRVLRGGGFGNDPPQCRVAVRCGSAIDDLNQDFGFRLAVVRR